MCYKPVKFTMCEMTSGSKKKSLIYPSINHMKVKVSCSLVVKYEIGRSVIKYTAGRSVMIYIVGLSIMK